MSNLTIRLLSIAAAAVLLPEASVLLAQQPIGGNAPSGIAYHYVGRAKLNFLDGTGVIYGYLSVLSGIDSPDALFQGAPSEATAYLTFRANIKFRPLAGNGPLGPGQFAVLPILTEAGSWSIYYSQNPSHNWDDPDSFSKDAVTVGTLDRALEQFSVYPTFSINAGASALRASTPFAVDGRVVNLRALAPNGVVDVTSGSPVPLAGSTATSPIFGLSGYALVAAR